MTDLSAAITAAAEACPFINRDALKRALEAAAPHLTADPTTENEGFRAYKAGLTAGRVEGAAAERKRIRQLAIKWDATYAHSLIVSGPQAGQGRRAPFAELLTDTP